MSIKDAIREATNNNPLGFEAAIKEELQARVAMALEAKMSDDEDEDEDEDDGDCDCDGNCNCDDK